MHSKSGVIGAFFIAATLGLALPFSTVAEGVDDAPSAETAQNVLRNSTYGYWRTDRGPMTLFILHPEGIGDGRYAWFDGFLIGKTTDRNDFIGRWHQDKSEIRCDPGNPMGEYSGIVAFKPNGDDEFIGKVWFCDDPSESHGIRWDGVLIAGEAWFNPDIWFGPDTRRPELDMSEQQAYALMYRTFGDEFDPTHAQSHVFDMTCDGGLDRVYVWRGSADDSGFRLSVVHQERPLFDGEDTSTVESVELDGAGFQQPGRCPIETAEEIVVEELDPLLRGTSARTLAPTCTRIMVGPSPLCRIYWDLKTGTFGFY